MAGLSDEESRQLPTMLDASALSRMELSTWNTNAGAFDVLGDLPNREGQHLRYES